MFSVHTYPDDSGDFAVRYILPTKSSGAARLEYISHYSIYRFEHLVKYQIQKTNKKIPDRL